MLIMIPEWLAIRVQVLQKKAFKFYRKTLYKNGTSKLTPTKLVSPFDSTLFYLFFSGPPTQTLDDTCECEEV